MNTHIKTPYSTSNTNKINPSISMDLQTCWIFLSLHLASDKLHKLTVPSMQFRT